MAYALQARLSHRHQDRLFRSQHDHAGKNDGENHRATIGCVRKRANFRSHRNDRFDVSRACQIAGAVRSHGPVDEWRRNLRAMRHENFSPIRGCHPDAHLYIQGEVHDPSAEVLHGISGNAGVFSTCHDVCKYLQMMLDEGSANGKQIIKPETIRTWTAKQNDIGSRGLGWDTPHGPYSQFASEFSSHSFGHTGYTGTSVWADFENKIYGVLLANRVFPTAENEKILHFRRVFYNAVVEAAKTDY